MTDTTSQTDQVLAEGVDDEPVESNRRLFEGRAFILISTLAALYAAFHMAALNGLSISDWTGIEIPFLPTFPMETWNFRLVHVAGALALGFLLFSGRGFAETRDSETPVLGYAAWALMVPALMALGMAFSFAVEIRNGAMWNGIDAAIKFNETWLFGAPLWIATGGAIVLSWFHKRERGAFSAPDVVLAVCGFAVATYLITIYGTLMRNSTGTPFAPIGMSHGRRRGHRADHGTDPPRGGPGAGHHRRRSSSSTSSPATCCPAS